MLKFIDNYFGKMLCYLLTRPRSRIPDKYHRILVIRPGGIGDAVLLARSINSIKNYFPKTHITMLAEQRNAGVLPLIPGVDTVLRYDHLFEFIQALRSQYDVVIDTEQWYRLSAVVARIINSPIKIGFDTNERRRMFTHCVPYDASEHEANNFLALLKPLGIDCQPDAEAGTLSLPHQSMSTVFRFFQPAASESYVTVFPGASNPEKRWGADRFRRVVEALSAFGIKTVVIGGKEDRQQGEAITGGGLGLNLAGLTSLSETAAVIQKSAMLLSGDSGVLHIAVGLGVPTVSLFGPGSVSKWAPQGERHIVINKEIPCSPCSSFGTIPPCPDNNRCMRDITVDEVVNAVTMLLTSVGAMSSRCCKRDWIETA